VAGYSEDAGERVNIPALRHLEIGRLDAIVASHPHADHVGGPVSVMEQVPVGHYVEPGRYYGSSTASRIHELIGGRGIMRHTVVPGDTLAGFGEANVAILHPRPEYLSPEGDAPEGLNNGSVVLRIAYRGQSILLTGDIEHETDSAILSWNARVQSTLLKAAHHGSRRCIPRGRSTADGRNIVRGGEQV